jgi:hypothetical protein
MYYFHAWVYSPVLVCVCRCLEIKTCESLRCLWVRFIFVTWCMCLWVFSVCVGVFYFHDLVYPLVLCVSVRDDLIQHTWAFAVPAHFMLHLLCPQTVYQITYTDLCNFHGTLCSGGWTADACKSYVSCVVSSDSVPDYLHRWWVSFMVLC